MRLSKQLSPVLLKYAYDYIHIMKILAMEIDVPGAQDEAFKPLLKAEAYRAWELYQAGVFRELYFREDRHAAVLVLECASLEEAREALGSLPLVQAGLIAFELISLAAYPGFARLVWVNKKARDDPGPFYEDAPAPGPPFS